MKRINFLLSFFIAAALQACSGGIPGYTLVSGKVTDASTGKAISGVQVSDGIQIVSTDKRGRYSLQSDCSAARNVFVIMPSEYDFSVNEWGGWADYRAIDTTAVKQTVDFKLTPRDDVDGKVRFLLLGDPQQMSSRPHSGLSWKYVCDGISEYRKGYDGPLYMISLGDMVTNEIEVEGRAEEFLEVMKTCGVTAFCTPGNHDHIQKAPTYYDSVTGFCRWFGPYNYSFNVGGVHFVFLDSCAWRETPDVKLTEGFNVEAINYLERDLESVDMETPVLIFTHCPMTKKYGGLFADSQLNFERFIKALEGRNVSCWYGHIHSGANYSYTPEELLAHAPGVRSLESHLVARCGGCWACSGEVARDGTPRGFVELDIDGTDMHWQFHSIDSNYGSVMSVCLPGEFRGEKLPSVKENALYCNIYMWDNLWTTPQIWIDGKKVAEMTKSVSDKYDATIDPRYAHFYPIWKNEGRMVPRDEPSRLYDNCHLFEYLPEKGVNKVEIRVTDRWGQTYAQEVNW